MIFFAKIMPRFKQMNYMEKWHKEVQENVSLFYRLSNLVRILRKKKGDPLGRPFLVWLSARDQSFDPRPD